MGYGHFSTDSKDKERTETEMFGMTRSEIYTLVKHNFMLSPKEMIVASLMSDMQHEVEHDMINKEQIRQKLNLFKYILLTNFNE